MSSPVASTSRRKSGRAVKAPEKFVPELAQSQAGPAGSKRKRDGDETENDASDVEEEPEDSEEEVESAEEEEPQKTRKKSKPKTARKPAAKKPKVNGTASRDDAPAPSIRLAARPKKPRKIAVQDEDAEGLYGDVFTKDNALEDVASQWVARLGQDEPAAVTELINFLVKSAGCDIEVTEDHINDTDNVGGVINDLQAQFQTQNITEYPLISKSKSIHNFREAFANFMSFLIQALHESDRLYEDDGLMENIFSWIGPLTTSSTRPFRHTATLAALTVTTALAKIAQIQMNTAAKVLRQQASEKQKKTANKGRVADFQKRIDAIEGRKSLVDAMLDEYYLAVFVNRYRDIDARIRLECIEALGEWIASYPKYFFTEQHCRYFGWMLSDTHGPMRQEVVKQIAIIMKKPENHAGMRHFVERFRPRIIEIAVKDSESSVRASAVQLADSIRQAGFLEPDDIDSIGKLIFDSEPRVRKALVPFFTENINDLYEVKEDELGGSEALEEFLVVEDEDDLASPRAGWIRYKCLAEILSNYDGEDQEELPSQQQVAKYLDVTGTESRFTLAAQALYEKTPELQEWESLAGYLLFDHTSEAAKGDSEKALREAVVPTDREEFILLDVLSSVIKTAVKKLEDAVSRSIKKAEKAEATEELELAARHLAALIPKLLEKYGPDPRTAAIVLRLEHVLDFGLYQELRQDSTEFAKHLDEITAQFNAHADNDVLKEAGAVFLRARQFEELEEVTESKLQSLWDDSMISLRKINVACQISVRGGLGHKALTELAHVLARIAELSSISNSVEYLEAEGANDDALPIAIILDVIARGLYEESNDDVRDMLEDEAVVSAIRIAGFYFMWKVRSLLNAISLGEEIADIDVDHLKEWSDTFSQNVITAFSSRSTLDPVRILGACALLENHTIFYSLRPSQKGKGKQPASGDDAYAHLQTLIKDIIPEVQLEITSIFDSLEKQFAKKSRKQLAQPGEDEEPEDLEEESDDDDDETNESERQIITLRAEQQLCELTGKIVLAIIAGAIDAEGSLKGKLRKRIERNHLKLGNNFRAVLAYLDEPKPKTNKKVPRGGLKGQIAAAAKNTKSKETVDEDEESEVEEEPEPEEEDEVAAAPPARKGSAKSKEVVEISEDEESDLSDPEAEEVVAEEEPEESVDGAVEEVNEDEDEIMGD